MDHYGFDMIQLAHYLYKTHGEWALAQSLYQLIGGDHAPSPMISLLELDTQADLVAMLTGYVQGAMGWPDLTGMAFVTAELMARGKLQPWHLTGYARNHADGYFPWLMCLQNAGVGLLDIAGVLAQDAKMKNLGERIVRDLQHAAFEARRPTAPLQYRFPDVLPRAPAPEVVQRAPTTGAPIITARSDLDHDHGLWMGF